MDPKTAYEILRSKVKPEGDAKQALLEVLKTDPKYAYLYADNVIEGRFPEAEEYIKTGAYWAYFYAKDVIKGRWKEAEEYIKKDPHFACNYAEDVIKGRWPEAEEYIKKDPHYAHRYAREVIVDTNFWKNQELLADLMKSQPKSEPKPNSELDDLKKQREELDKRIKQLECA
jgi:hypothetical protein